MLWSRSPGALAMNKSGRYGDSGQSNYYHPNPYVHVMLPHDQAEQGQEDPDDEHDDGREDHPRPGSHIHTMRPVDRG
jgi:hypothetical protein